MNVRTRAIFVARIFDILAWIALIIGSLAVVVFVITGFAGGLDTNYLYSVINGWIVGAVAALYTALIWASISLSTVIAGYIAQRSDQS